MDRNNYGPLAILIGRWSSGTGWTGENRAPDPDRVVENTKFRQETLFEPIGDAENHEQILYGLRYSTKAWEEGDDEKPFHEEVGYWLWDAKNGQVMKCFNIPRGMSILAGGKAHSNSKIFEMSAELGSEIYGLSSNKFLDNEFKTIRYDVKIEILDENTFSYDEDTQIQIKGQSNIFHHTEKNVMKRVSD